MHHAPFAFTLTALGASLVLVAAAPQPLHAAENAPPATESQAVAPLMRQANFLLAHGRADLARGVLQKVLAVQPDHEGALLLLGDLELRSNQNAAAQSLLERLQRTQPNSAVTREMETLWRLYTTDRLRLTQLRQLRAGGKTAQARVLARQLFPDDAPPGSLASEFADLLADTPARRQAAARALSGKVARDGSPRDRFALYNLQAADRATLAPALRGYGQLAEEHSIPADQLIGPWSAALQRARAGQAGAEGRRLAAEQAPLYNRTMPSELRIAQADRRRSSGDGAPEPVVQARERGYAALSARHHEDAEAAFREALRLRPEDASSRAGLGIVRLREGRYADARQWLEQAIARTRDPAARRDWTDLAASARYWDQVGQARELIAAERHDVADALLSDTIPLQPEQTEATLLLAGVRSVRGQDASADRLYADVLARDPSETRAWRGRLALGMRDPAAPTSPDTWLDEAQTQARRLNVPPGDLIDAGALRAAADRELAQGRASAALRLLERGVAMLGQDAWLRHDLAKLYLRDGLPDLAKSVMDEGLAQAPQDPQMRYAAALIALSSDREADALATLDAIPPESRDASQAQLATTARFEGAMRQYREALARGDRDGTSAALATAERNTGGEATRQLRLARAELGAGHAEAARRRIDTLDRSALSFDDRIALATLQADAGRETEALRSFDQLAQQAGEPAQALAVLQAQEGVALDRIDRAQSAARPADAHRIAETSLQAWPVDDARVARPRAQAQARLWLAARAPDRALATLDATPAPTTPATEAWAWQRVRIRALADSGRRDEAIASLTALHRQTTQAPHSEPLQDAVLATDIDQPALAREWLRPLLAARPHDPDVRLEAARQSRRAGRYNEAMAHLKAAAPATPAAANGSTAAAVPSPAVQSAMNALEARRQPQVEVGWMQSQYSGNDGISSMRAREVPLVVTWPVGYDGHVFAQVDAVKLEAGTLRPGGLGVPDFGTLLFDSTSTSGGLPAPQNAQGANVGFGWLEDRQRFDLGMIGVGMPVRNVVGGWQRSITRNLTDIGIEVARRVEARSLMTYVGATDPRTGQVWGGVTQTFAALRLSQPLDDVYTLSTRLKLSFYDGQHVQRNTAWQWRSVIDRDVVRSEPLNLNVGVAAMFWQFQRNAGFYSYGHGGYYSPQRYFSLAVPVELTGRQGTWSYLLRASLGHSWTHEDGAPYYPLDPALQQSPALTSPDPRYAGGSGGGLGGSLRAGLEKRLTPQWSLGAWLDIERSEDYSPTRAMIYLRHFFKPQSAPVPVPPQPVVPYSQF